MEVPVLANGTVKSIQLKGGSPRLAQSAQSALRGRKWEKANHETAEFVEFHFSPS